MDAESELGREIELFEEAAQDPGHIAKTLFRTWTCDSLTVVVGRGSNIDSEVDLNYCAANSIPVVRRASGGSAVLIGPGTLQYAFILPHHVSTALSSISGCKSFCNEILVACMDETGALGADPCGDLVFQGFKIAGLALKRSRRASLLHGSILMTLELSLISGALRHPPREPGYRQGRAHEKFVRNWGPVDAVSLEREVTARLGLTCNNGRPPAGGARIRAN